MRSKTLTIFVAIAILLFLQCKRRSSEVCGAGSGLSETDLSGQTMATSEVSLSFEDIGGDSWKAISEFLNAQGISATYFLTGSMAKRYSDRVGSLIKDGHTIASMGWSGDNISTLSDPVADIRRSDVVLLPSIQKNQFMLRSAGELNKEAVDELIASGLGKYVGSVSMDIGWRTSGFSDDLECVERSIEMVKCRDRYVSEISRQTKGIVNFRGSGSFTRDLVREIVIALTASKFKFIRVDEIPEIRAKLLSTAAQTSSGAASTCNEY